MWKENTTYQIYQGFCMYLKRQTLIFLFLFLSDLIHLTFTYYTAGEHYIRSHSRLQKYSTRAELRVVLVMKLAEEEVRVSGNDTMERESGWSAAAPHVPCRALRAWISRRSTKASKCSRSCGETRPRTSESRENYGRDTIGEGRKRGTDVGERRIEYVSMLRCLDRGIEWCLTLWY